MSLLPDLILWTWLTGSLMGGMVAVAILTVGYWLARRDPNPIVLPRKQEVEDEA